MREKDDTQQDPETTIGRLLAFRRPPMTETAFEEVLSARSTGGLLFAPGEYACLPCAREARDCISAALRRDRPSPWRPTVFLEKLPGAGCRFCGPGADQARALSRGRVR